MPELAETTKSQQSPLASTQCKRCTDPIGPSTVGTYPQTSDRQQLEWGTPQDTATNNLWVLVFDVALRESVFMRVVFSKTQRSFLFSEAYPFHTESESHVKHHACPDENSFNATHSCTSLVTKQPFPMKDSRNVSVTLTLTEFNSLK